MFVCRPRELEEVYDKDGRWKMVFPVRILERHPFTAQSFIPLGFSTNVRYLVIVAPTLPVHHSNPFQQDYGLTSTSNPAENPSGRERQGAGLPDLQNIKAFIAYGDQAVTYGPGTWHAPMVALGEKPVDFVVVQCANGVTAEDVQEFEFETNDSGERLVVDLGEIPVDKARL